MSSPRCFSPSRISRDTATVTSLTIALVLCLKLFYSTATPDELTWLLYPTTMLVKIFTSIDFLFDAGRGYVAVDTPVVIGPGCAGLNFFVIALCMSTFSFIAHLNRHKLYWLLAFVLLTYVVTLFVNAFRIVGGITLLNLGSSLHFNASGTLHTLQGALFYFIFLVLYYAALRALMKSRSCHEGIH